MSPFGNFDPKDPAQMAELLVNLEYNPDDIVDTLVNKYSVEIHAAIDLVYKKMLMRIDRESIDEVDKGLRAAAVTAEWDLTKTMHEFKE
jgi:hypothetical protein